ncbi:YidB family protein [Streptomyces sp. NPDC006393]|uniref:YidB family protein n=1 Tax=Streptomyces sp. NPDC006393 TaxID=3156763 RepID=UPI0033EDBA7A
MAETAKNSSDMTEEMQALLEATTRGLSSGGLKREVDSWLGSGPNEPVTAKQIESASGPNKVAAACRETGVSLESFAAVLPDIIDEVSPRGKVEISSRSAIPPKRIEQFIDDNKALIRRMYGDFMQP